MNAKLFIDTPITPLEDYPGRKGAAGSWQKILAEVPRCELFIDAMCGSGIIGSLIQGCKVYMNDIDPITIDALRKKAGNNVQFGNQHYLEVIKRFNNGSPNRVFYFDPPYLITTRSTQAKLYRHDWVLEDHKVFLKAIQAIKSPVIVSHYPCDLYDQSLKKWRKLTYTAATHGGGRQESMYMNYPQPVLLQFPNLTGANFTDRQRIQRKVERLIKRLKNEPGNERAAILSAIISHFTYLGAK
jgi:DNA adenine methylase